MNFTDIQKYFRAVQICEIEAEYDYSFEPCPSSPYSICSFKIQEKGEYTFSVSQKGNRFFRRDAGYKYSPASLALFRVSTVGGKVGYHYMCHQKKDCKRDTYLKHSELELGDYVLLASVEWHQETKDKSFVVTSYGIGPVEFEDLTDSIDKRELELAILKNGQ